MRENQRNHAGIAIAYIKNAENKGYTECYEKRQGNIS